MAITVSAPRRSSSRISSARSYEGVAYKYADAFQKALQQQEDNSVQNKVYLYQIGAIKFSDLQKFLTDKINSSPEGSNQRTQYLQLLAQSTKQEKVTFENNQKDLVSAKRSELTQQYEDGGITPQENLKIVSELKKIADPKSGAYQDLVAEEAKVKGEIATQGAGYASKTSRENLDFTLAKEKNNNQQLIDQYKSGQLDGYSLDSQLYASGQRAMDAIKTAQASGANISQSEWTDVLNNTETVKQRLGMRELGVVFDAVNKAGEVKTVSLPQLQLDQQQASPDFIRKTLNVVQSPQDPTGKTFVVYNSATGAIDKGFSDQYGAFGMPKDIAAAYVNKAEPGYSVSVVQPTGNGTPKVQKWFFDPKQQNFYPEGADNLRSPTIVNNPSAASRYLTEGKASSFTDYLKTAYNTLKSFTASDSGQFNLQGLMDSFKNNNATPSAEASPSADLNLNKDNVLGPTMGPSAPTFDLSKLSLSNTPAFNFNPEAPSTPGLSFAPQPTQSTGPSMSPSLDWGGLSKKIGDFTSSIFSDFKLPSFNLNPGAPGGSPSIPNSSTVGASSSGVASSQNGSPGFLQSIGNFFSPVVNTVKNLFGI